MKQSLTGKHFSAGQIRQSITAFFLLFCTAGVQAQGNGNGNGNVIPELIFKGPVLTAGTNGQDGAVYRFNNVASGIDATVQIVRRSGMAVVVSSIDDEANGWSKALQPTVGIPGMIAPGQTWWVEFEMHFFVAGTETKKKINSFKITALDVDGDGAYIQEFVQMNKISSVANSAITSLTIDPPLPLPVIPDDLGGYNLNGTDQRVTGPVANFLNIDTAATAVMTTFTYTNKDAFKFLLGGKSSGGTSNAGMRMNSLWFKAFNLMPNVALPVRLTAFGARLDQKDVTLDWASTAEENFSHYVIERSSDGIIYTDLALVFGAGSAHEKASYEYKDKDVASATGALYYRLRLTEKSNSSSYSPVRIIRLGKEQQGTQLITYPNPVTANARLTLPAAWQGKIVALDIYTAAGLRVQSIALLQASQTELLQMSALPRGMYLLEARCEGRLAAQKIIKQ